MRQRRHRLRLAAEAIDALLAAGHVRRQHLERHLAVQVGVFGEVHLAHAAFTELVEDPVVRNCLSDHPGAPSSVVAGRKGEAIIQHGEKGLRGSPETGIEGFPSS